MGRVMEVGITAIGIAVPAYRQVQKDLANFIAERLQLNASEKRRLKAIYRASGIDYRHTVINDYVKQLGEFIFFPNDDSLNFPTTKQRMKIYQKNALPLAIKAIQNCFSDKGEIYNSITHLITVSCTGMYAPGLDIEIIQYLNLSTTIHRTVINFMGCYGTFNAIKTASTICKADPSARVLVVSLELCSIHLQPSSSLDHMISGAIFSDGAGALLVEAHKDHIKSMNIKGFYCDILPESNNEMVWNIGDYGFDITLSQYVAKLIESGITQFTHKALMHYNLKKEEIDHYAIHPGGLSILKACEQALKITENDNQYSYEVLRNYGNMSSATIIFVFKAMWENFKTINNAKNIYSCAFGPGLTLESMLLKVNYV